MRDFDLKETINLLEEALDEYKEALFLLDYHKMETIKIRAQCILSRLPDEYLYIKSKDVYFNEAFFESDLPDLIEELKKK